MFSDSRNSSTRFSHHTRKGHRAFNELMPIAKSAIKYIEENGLGDDLKVPGERELDYVVYKGWMCKSEIDSAFTRYILSDNYQGEFDDFGED